MVYSFVSYVVCRYHIFSCHTTFILSTQHFCRKIRMNILTRVTVPVILGMHNELATGIFFFLFFQSVQ